MHRLPLLADIVPPRPVPRPAGFDFACGQHHAACWWLAAALALAGCALAWRGARHLRRHLARGRLRRLASRLVAAPARTDVADLLPGVWAELRRAGFAPQAWSPRARALRERLLYARHAEAGLLAALLDELRT